MATLTSGRSFQGANAIFLENDEIVCVCLPEFGGKIASLYHKPTRFELLFQNPKKIFGVAALGSAFADFEACGFDDGFPNIDSGLVKTSLGETEYFDHGEIWTAKFLHTLVSDELSLRYDSPYLGYRYEKSLFISGNTLTIQYHITNESRVSFPCIWVCHCLVNYREDMQLVFPKRTRRAMTVVDSALLGPSETQYKFPKDIINGQLYDFSRVPPIDGSTMIKYYCTEPVQEGKCGFHYPTEGLEAMIHYDPIQLPYLGFWLTAGGYRGDCNCALEPSSGYYDSIGIAQRNDKCPQLKPGEEFRFDISISLRKYL